MKTAAAVAFATIVGPALQAPSRPAATPVAPIAGIVEAFQSHAIVALGDGRQHGDADGHTFIMSLIRDSRFQSAANDIVLERCNARYQDRIDRFTTGGEVDADSLADAWRNSTQVNASQRDCPGCEAIFRSVRDANLLRPRDRRLRVLLGDPPIDWSAVRTRDDYAKWLALRDSFPADLIAREVVAKGRRALVVYGGMHLQRKNLLANYDSEGAAETLVSRLEATTGRRAFTIWAASKLAAMQPDVASWRAPALALLRGTLLGALDFADYYQEPLAARRIPIRDGQPDFAHPVPREEWRTLRMEDQFDAVLYLGPTLTLAEVLKPDMCADTGYMKTLQERMALVDLKPEIERLNKFCAK